MTRRPFDVAAEDSALLAALSTAALTEVVDRRERRYVDADDAEEADAAAWLRRAEAAAARRSRDADGDDVDDEASW